MDFWDCFRWCKVAKTQIPNLFADSGFIIEDFESYSSSRIRNSTLSSMNSSIANAVGLG